MRRMSAALFLLLVPYFLILFLLYLLYCASRICGLTSPAYMQLYSVAVVTSRLCGLTSPEYLPLYSVAQLILPGLRRCSR